MLPRVLVLAAVAFLCILTSMGAVATAQRTFVASNGNDANPCSLVSPCRSFASAIAQTTSGGEVIVLDSAGYGPVTITQSVSIIAPSGVYAGISVPLDGTGVAITGAGVHVLLRGLTINNIGGGANAVGIGMTNGAALRIESCAISNFPLGFGALIQTAASVKIADSVFSDVFHGAIAGYGAKVSIVNSQFFRMGTEGVAIEGGMSGTTVINITDSLVSGFGASVGSECIANHAPLGSVGNIVVSHVTVTECGYAIYNQPDGAGTMTVSNSIVAGNGFGFDNYGSPGTFNSLSTNLLSGNVMDTTGTIAHISGQ